MSATQQHLDRPDTTHAPINPGAIMELGLGFWASKTLLSAVELGLFTELASEPLTRDEVSARLSLHPRSAGDFLDALVSVGMLTRDDDRYANTPETDLFLDRNKPSYIGGMLEMANARLYPFWGRLTEALHTGGPQNEARVGEDFFAKIYENPELLGQFLHAMTGLSTGAAHRIAAGFPFDRHGSVLDLGCAEGGLVVTLAQSHPHLTAVGFDLPPVQAPFERFVSASGLKDRVSFVGGDFLNGAIPTADVITLGHILHDWDLATKKQLLTKVYEALPPGGAVIVFDAIIDDDRSENTFGLLMSLNMLIETSGGSDYTGADCQGWMREVGFTDTYVEHLAGPDSMVVGIK